MTSQLLRMIDLRCFVDKGQMMLKKIAKIKNFNNFMLWHLVDFKYGDTIFENFIILLIFPHEFW